MKVTGKIAVARRTHKARTLPIGSTERALANMNPIESEAAPSHPWALLGYDLMGRRVLSCTGRTRAEMKKLAQRLARIRGPLKVENETSGPDVFSPEEELDG